MAYIIIIILYRVLTHDIQLNTGNRGYYSVKNEKKRLKITQDNVKVMLKHFVLIKCRAMISFR